MWGTADIINPLLPNTLYVLEKDPSHTFSTTI